MRCREEIPKRGLPGIHCDNIYHILPRRQSEKLPKWASARARDAPVFRVGAIPPGALRLSLFVRHPYQASKFVKGIGVWDAEGKGRVLTYRHHVADKGSFSAAGSREHMGSSGAGIGNGSPCAGEHGGAP